MAKTTLRGQRWGRVVLYECDQYPHNAVAPITFLWMQKDEGVCEEIKAQKHTVVDEIGRKGERTLWMWVHPSAYAAVWKLLEQVCNKQLPPSPSASRVEKIQLCSLKDQLVKFRLTGPASNRILGETLELATISSTDETLGPAAEKSPQKGKPVDKATQVAQKKTGQLGEQECSSSYWWQSYYSDEENKSAFQAQAEIFQHVAETQSHDEVPPCMVLSLTVRDPRVLRPSLKTKTNVNDLGELQ